jgi:uncharacterized protein (DUF433 family)
VGLNCREYGAYGDPAVSQRRFWCRAGRHPGPRADIIHVMIAHAPNLSAGLYSSRDAALFARLSTRTMARWVHGEGRSRAALRSQFEDNPERVVSFLDFVQAMAIRAIRLEKKVPLQKIRACIEIAEGDYGITYPFARKHSTYLFDDDIVLRVEDALIQMTGKYRHNHLIREVAELYMEKLSFDAEGLAREYVPFESRGHQVRLTPEIHFGYPTVYPSRRSVQTLVEAYYAEGGYGPAARAFDVDEDEIKVALEYEDYLHSSVE